MTLKKKQTMSMMRSNSVQSINPCKSVNQTVYDIVKARGDEFKLVPSEGAGSTFYFTIPKTETDRST